MTWNGKRVLVTGAGGFIGSHVAERFVELGADVRAMVHYNAHGKWGWLDESPLRGEMEVVAGDIRDRDSVTQALNGITIAVHLAALIAIPYSYIAPDSYIHTNVGGTLNVLQAARNLGVERVVHTSTSEVYGTARYVPMDESHPLRAQSPYAASKIAADKLAESFHLSFDLPVVTVRPFNTYGPRQSARAVIPAIVRDCLEGQTLQLGNLHPTRDLNYVKDTVEGFVMAASAPDAVGRVVNIGTGREISIGDLVRLIGNLMGVEISIHQEAERQRPDKSEVERLLADNTVAKDILGWRSAWTLETGLPPTIDWIREHRDGYRAGTYAV
ncbi:MAG: dTDP-glucose 4,6-dehydratase [Chloroflexi bacterium]|nr:MAG: dTDP-glucose 4,6-dehydratase [Chloroflexota bacterium]